MNLLSKNNSSLMLLAEMYCFSYLPKMQTTGSRTWKTSYAFPGICMLFLFIGLRLHSQVSSAVFKNRSPKLISAQFSFTEGPAADKNGNIFFTDQPNNRIWKYDINGQLSIFLNKTGRSNGMCFDRKGNLITCADEHNQLWSISPTGKVKILLTGFKGRRFNGPNDLWIDPQGGIYFTDPYFQRDYWQRKHPDSLLGGENLYYLAPGNKAAIIVDGPLQKPNGLTGTSDGKFLYVAEMGKGRILKYTILKNGKLSKPSVFVNDLADGIRLDESGNLYIAGKGVTVYNPSGEKIDHIDIPEEWTANLCFGGSDRKTLFITASKSVYILPVKIKGAE